MEFRTKIDIPASELRINHHSKVMLLGSCFALHIGQQLLQSKFDINVNPFGILYNPASIATVIHRIIDSTLFTADELRENQGLYVSFLHHGSFSKPDKEETLQKINASLQQAIKDLQNTDTLIITFGTAYVYTLKESGSTVANCHKFPASIFNRERMSVECIVSIWNKLIKELKNINPGLNILFTVSPIRHWKDGAHDNQLSKATLLLAIDALQNEFGNLHYFPSYEIVMDELRDYRFYDEDMIHPNPTAIGYIWERFTDTFFDRETMQIISQWQKLLQAVNHRPFNIQAGEHKQFLRQTLLKLQTFQDKYPYLDCEKEIVTLKNRI